VEFLEVIVPKRALSDMLFFLAHRGVTTAQVQGRSEYII